MDAVEALQNQLAERDVEYSPTPYVSCFSFSNDGAYPGDLQRASQKGRIANPSNPLYFQRNGYLDYRSRKRLTSAYWAKHIRQTVRFSDGLQVLLQDSDRLLLEVGAGQTLSTFARRHPTKVKSQTVVSSLRHPKEQTPDLAFMLNSLGQIVACWS